MVSLIALHWILLSLIFQMNWKWKSVVNVTSQRVAVACVKCQIIHIIIMQSLCLYIEEGYHWQFGSCFSAWRNGSVNRYSLPCTLNIDGPPEKLILLACILAHVDSPNTTLSYIYGCHVGTLDVSMLASGLGGSGIGHNFTVATT